MTTTMISTKLTAGVRKAVGILNVSEGSHQVIQVPRYYPPIDIIRDSEFVSHDVRCETKLTAFLKRNVRDEHHMEMNLLLCGHIMQMIRSVTEGFGAESCMVQLRLIAGNSEFWKTPRWHWDGTYYGRPGCKFVTTLQGPSTLFCEVDERTKESIKPLVRRGMDLRSRELIDRQLAKYPKLQTDNQHGVVYRYGTNAAVHSEPYINTSRMFLAITPGSRAELRQRKQS